MRILLPVQGHRFDPCIVFWEDSTCHVATAEALVESTFCSKRRHLNEQPMHTTREWPLLAPTGEEPGTSKINEFVN